MTHTLSRYVQARRHNFEAPYRRRIDTRCPQWLSRYPHCMNPGCVLSKVVEAVLLIHIHVADLLFRLWRSLIHMYLTLSEYHTWNVYSRWVFNTSSFLSYVLHSNYCVKVFNTNLYFPTPSMSIDTYFVEIGKQA